LKIPHEDAALAMKFLKAKRTDENRGKEFREYMEHITWVEMESVFELNDIFTEGTRRHVLYTER
jgi:hypothetical protein